MKIQELRDFIGKSDRKYVEKAFAETYKALTKRQKEEIDPVIIDILNGKGAGEKKTADEIPFEELQWRIEEFLGNAYAQNYFAPNRVIPKSQRPKWRFIVKNFIKKLEKIPPESENYERAVRLLTDLYKLICYACNYYLFSTEDPFRSIGWNQTDLFELVVKKTFATGYDREDISNLLLLATTGGLSRISLYIQQETVLISALKTNDVRQAALEETKKLVEGQTEKLAKMDEYEFTEAVNELCAVAFLLFIALGEPDQGIQYYFKHAEHHLKEITLYCALRLMEWMEEDDLWIRVYEYGIGKKIKPRKELVDNYKKRIMKSSEK